MSGVRSVVYDPGCPSQWPCSKFDSFNRVKVQQHLHREMKLFQLLQEAQSLLSFLSEGAEVLLDVGGAQEVEQLNRGH